MKRIFKSKDDAVYSLSKLYKVGLPSIEARYLGENASPALFLLHHKDAVKSILGKPPLYSISTYMNIAKQFEIGTKNPIELYARLELGHYISGTEAFTKLITADSKSHWFLTHGLHSFIRSGRVSRAQAKNRILEFTKVSDSADTGGTAESSTDLRRFYVTPSIYYRNRRPDEAQKMQKIKKGETVSQFRKCLERGTFLHDGGITVLLPSTLSDWHRFYLPDDS